LVALETEGEMVVVVVVVVEHSDLGVVGVLGRG
jgi:hypothetical protein